MQRALGAAGKYTGPSARKERGPQDDSVVKIEPALAPVCNEKLVNRQKLHDRP